MARYWASIRGGREGLDHEEDAGEEISEDLHNEENISVAKYVKFSVKYTIIGKQI